MNRKLALVLTVVIFAAIAFCFLRPTDSYDFVTYGEFGNIKSVYVEDDVEIPIKVSGETDLLTVTRLEHDGDVAAYIYFRPAEGCRFSMGSVASTLRVHPWKEGTPFDLATVERYESGKWVHYTDIDDFGFGMPAIDFITGPFVVTQAQQHLPINLPFYEPGKYRVTFNFRELSDEPKGLNPPEEPLHHITMEYEMPAASDSRYDIAYLSIIEPELVSLDFTRIKFVIRANEGEAPFRRYDKAEVEKLVDGEWVAQDIARTLAEPNYYQRSPYRTGDHFSGYVSDERFSGYHIDMDCRLDPDSDYRITMYFTETERLPTKYPTFNENYMPLQIRVRTLDPLDRIFNRFIALRIMGNIGLQFLAK